MSLFCSKLFHGFDLTEWRLKCLQWPAGPTTSHALHTGWIHLLPLSSQPGPSQTASLVFLKCTRRSHIMEPLYLLIFLPENTFPLFFYTTCYLTSVRPPLKCYLSSEAFPDGYDIVPSSLIKYFPPYFHHHIIYNMFNYLLIYCLLPQ